MSLIMMSSSSSRDRNKYLPPYLFLPREDDDEVTDIGKHDFGSVLLHPMLSNANPLFYLLSNANLNRAINLIYILRVF